MCVDVTLIPGKIGTIGINEYEALLCSFTVKSTGTVVTEKIFYFLVIVSAQFCYEIVYLTMTKLITRTCLGSRKCMKWNFWVYYCKSIVDQNIYVDLWNCFVNKFILFKSQFK